MSGRAIPLIVGLGLAPLIAQEQTTFRSAVDVVSVPVSVTDRNKPVPDLTRGDFELKDNDIPQDISLTAIDAMPTDVTFLVDTSGSLTGTALDRLELELQDMSSLLQPNDRVRLVSFARDPTDVFGLLPGGATLDFSRMTSGGTTSLYDALVNVLVAYPSTDRPHLVFVVTDGRDNSSFVSASHVVDVARTSSAVLVIALVSSSNPLVREGGRIDAVDPMTAEQSVVTIPRVSGSNVVGLSGLPTPGSPMSAPAAISRNAGPYAGGPNTAALKDAAAMTGGLVYSDTSRTPVPQLFRRVIDDFRAGYVLTYTPTGVGLGGIHTITVRTKNRQHIVRARRSYVGGG